ncbi:MAG: RiPP maturation radical SAM C-methyltransferase [Desulfocapsa sp.]|nr:RiPP maturation radical SAM C-methyltransferase [Desulfocapsa sp.]
MDTTFSERYRVLLIVPPFRSVVRPALSVSLLKAGLPNGEYESKVLYLNLMFADKIGVHLHETLGSNHAVSLGDFLFSFLLFNRSERDLHLYVQDLLFGTAAGRLLLNQLPFKEPEEGLRKLICQTRLFVDEAVSRIVDYNASLVGVTSSFQENCAALLFYHQLKEQQPETVTIMGGANCYGIMGRELLKSFPQLDYVAQGECDITFPAAVKCIRSGQNADSVAGFMSRRNMENNTETRLSSEDLENSPFPDFTDYFLQFAESRSRRKIQPGIPLETSRGCWWGAKARCLFCGLNNELAFRRKSATRILEEIEYQVEKHQIRSFNVVDNMLDMRHFNELFPALTHRRGLSFFWETPGHLSRSQIASMAGAGITHIQPGIESFSDHSLKLMNKPTTRLYNVQTLKWCAEYGITVYWNHLLGIPGEFDADVQQITDDVSLLSHLRPPPSTLMIRLQRFSRYFEEHEEYCFGNVRPAAVYKYLYPFDRAVLQNLVYHFETDWEIERTNSHPFKKLQSAIQKWNRVYLVSLLVSIRLPAMMLILDSRPSQPHLIHVLSGLDLQVIETIDRVRPKEQIAELLDLVFNDQELQNTLDHLMKRGLVLCGKEGYLALQTPGGLNRLGRWLSRFRPMPGGHLRHRIIRRIVRSFVNRLR